MALPPSTNSLPFLIPITMEGRVFYDSHQYVALQNLMKEGYSPLFMPALVDARNDALSSPLWQGEYSTPSVRVTGRTNLGTPLVVYSHIPSYLSNPENIQSEVENGLVKFAARMPQKEFQRLVGLDGAKDCAGNRLVWVVDYSLKNALAGFVSTNQVLDHPETIPFFGGEQRAQEYMRRYNVRSNSTDLTIRVRYKDDLSEQPVGRLLFLGLTGFSGGNNIGGGGSFVGVRQMVPLEKIINA